MDNIKTRIRARLLTQGMTLTGWAVKNGFNPDTVSKVLYRVSRQEVRGRVSRQIIKKLEEDTGVKICEISKKELK